MNIKQKELHANILGSSHLMEARLQEREVRGLSSGDLIAIRIMAQNILRDVAVLEYLKANT